MASNYSCTPLTAWRELGHAEPRGRRQVGRITRAAQELATYDRALDEVTRKGRDLAKDPPPVEYVVLAREIQGIYAERLGLAAFDNNTDGFAPDDPDANVTGMDAIGDAE